MQTLWWKSKIRIHGKIQILEKELRALKKGYILACQKETGNYNINENHHYYDQIQGQLHIANRKSYILAI